MTYHLVFNWSNTTGGTSGADTAYPSGSDCCLTPTQLLLVVYNGDNNEMKIQEHLHAFSFFKHIVFVQKDKMDKTKVT